jgi:phage-related protein
MTKENEEEITLKKLDVVENITSDDELEIPTNTTPTSKDKQPLIENNEADPKNPTFMQNVRNLTGSVLSPIGSVISPLLPFKNLSETITLNPANWHLDIVQDNKQGVMRRGKAIATNTFTTILGIAAGVGTYFGIKEVSGTIAETLAKVFSNIFKDVLPAFSKEILETIINIATPLIAGFAVAHVADKGINKIARTYNENKELIEETNNKTFQKKEEQRQNENKEREI